LVHSGVREVTLLGQNVNSYGKKEGLCTFAELLSKINGVEGLLRIRFTTSHPKDLSDDLIYAFDRLEKLCTHIHLPVQSGSNRVLTRMNRRYTRQIYLEKVDRLRNHCPDIAISTDIIAGFPGERESDFEATLDLIRIVRYDNLFAFKYSDRPNAPATRFAAKIPDKEKKERLQRVLDLQERITTEKHRSLVGTTAPILVEGISKKQKTSDSPSAGETAQWTGRTSTNKIVNFIQGNPYALSGEPPIGRMVDVKIENAFAHSLWGKYVKHEPASFVFKGEDNYAA
jgi:tRNA-2-methylthio-N6-dimethylallyladenosine synthase